MGKVLDFNKRLLKKRESEKTYQIMSRMIDIVMPYINEEEHIALNEAKEKYNFDDFDKLYDQIEIAIVMRS